MRSAALIAEFTEIFDMKALFLALPLALAAGSAFAVDPIEKQVLITASIPASTFYVEPIGNWINDPQELVWRPHQETLEPVRRQFDAKSTTGPIAAYLVNPAKVTSGIDSVDLNVTVGNTVLTTTSQEVLPTAQAAAGAVMDFVVAAQKPGTGYIPGNYQGFVNMVFETTP